MNDALTLSPYRDDSRFELDGSLKQIRSMAAPVEWHGNGRNHMLGNFTVMKQAASMADPIAVATEAVMEAPVEVVDGQVH